MQDLYREDVLEWEFPDLEHHAMHEGSQALSMEMKDQQIEEKKAEELKIKQELEIQKNEYAKKINLIACMVEKIENPLIECDHELKQMLEDIIKQTIKKLIYRELSMDPHLIGHIIQELSKLIHEKNGMLTIQLSETDYQRLDKSDIPSAALINVNADLTEGDIVIHSNASEIRSLLNERIDKILGLSS